MVVSCLPVLIPTFPFFRVVASTHTAPSAALGLRGEATGQHHTENQWRNLDTEPMLPAPGPGPFCPTPWAATFPECELQHTQDRVPAEVGHSLERSGELGPQALNPLASGDLRAWKSQVWPLLTPSLRDCGWGLGLVLP